MWRLFLFASIACPLCAQQRANNAWQPEVADPKWSTGDGPVVALDEAHDNFHTISGRYAKFAELLRLDGYVVRANTEPFRRETLAGVDVLVIANALHPSNRASWSLPTPSCFTDAEVAAVRAWVGTGGALFLIADHMPFPGAVTHLAGAFGATFSNGYTFTGEQQGHIAFRKETNLLAEHTVTRGIDVVRSFTGSAFRIKGDHRPLLTLPADAFSLEPETAREFDRDTTRVPVGGWLQGAVLEWGQGRVAIFGEAAMFTSQTNGTISFGMGTAGAEQNPTFLRRLMYWLAAESER